MLETVNNQRFLSGERLERTAFCKVGYVLASRELWSLPPLQGAFLYLLLFPECMLFVQSRRSMNLAPTLSIGGGQNPKDRLKTKSRRLSLVRPPYVWTLFARTRTKANTQNTLFRGSFPMFCSIPFSLPYLKLYGTNKPYLFFPRTMPTQRFIDAYVVWALHAH